VPPLQEGLLHDAEDEAEYAAAAAAAAAAASERDAEQQWTDAEVSLNRFACKKRLLRLPP
jgi:hypothetical protein